MSNPENDRGPSFPEALKLWATTEDPFCLNRLEELRATDGVGSGPILIGVPYVNLKALESLTRIYGVRAIYSQEPQEDQLLRFLTPDLVGTDTESLRRDLQDIFLDGFFDPLAQLLALLSGAKFTKDQVKRLFHRLAGGAGTCGFLEVGKLAKALEADLANLHSNPLLDHPDELERALCKAFSKDWLGPWPKALPTDS